MPAQKNCVARVAMNEGMPTLATRTPLIDADEQAADEAATTASQPSSYSLNSTAKTKPENAITEGNDRSISPAAITKVRPSARRISGGSVDGTSCRCWARRKTSGAVVHEEPKSRAKTTMIGRPSTRPSDVAMRPWAIPRSYRFCCIRRFGQLGDGHLLRQDLGDDLAAVDDTEAIGDLVDMGEVVLDIDAGASAGLDLARRSRGPCAPP